MARSAALLVLRRGQIRAVDDDLAVTVDTPLVIDVVANDRGSGLYVSHINNIPIVDGGAAVAIVDGQVELASGQLTLTPDAAYTGPIGFKYTVSDGTQSRIGLAVGEVT